MAFNPQPLTFGPYTSTYVDPKYEVLGEALNKRYESNYAANDALEAKLLELESAPFENDKAERIKLIKDTQAKLQEFAERGDFENLSLGVVKASKEYAKQASGILANKKSYDAYRASLDEMVKDKSIDEGTKNKLLNYSTQNYKGIIRDPATNTINPDSMFKGVGAVRNPDVLKTLDEHLAKIKADGDMSRIKRVDQIQYDESGNPLPGRYEVLTDKGWETVSDEDILTSFNTVMKKPEIQSWLSQQALLNTYDMSDEELANWAQTSIKNGAEVKQSLEEKKTQIEITAGNILQKDPATLTPQEKQVVDAYNNITSQISETDRKISNFNAAGTNPQVLKNMAVKQWYESKQQEYQDYALSTYGYKKETSDALEVAWDPAYLKQLDAATSADKNGKVISEVITEMPSLEISTATGGYTATNNYIKQTEATVAALDKELADPNNPLSADLRMQKETQKRNLESNLAFEKEKLNRAYKIAGVDPENVNDVLANKMVSLGYNPTTKEEIKLSQSELVDAFKRNNFNIGKTAQWLKANKNLGIVEWSRTIDFTSPEASQFFQLLKQSADQAYKEGKSPEEAIYNQLNAETHAKVQQILEQNAKSGITMTTLFPGRTDAERKVNTKFIRDYFTNGIPNHIHAWTQGTGDPENSTITTLMQAGTVSSDYIVDLEKISVNSESSNPGSILGEDILVIPLRNKDNNTYVNIFVPANDVYTPSMKQALNSPANRFSRIMGRATSLPSLPGEENYYKHTIQSTFPGVSGPMEFEIDPLQNRVRVIYNGETSEWYAPQDSEFKRLYLDKKGIGDKF